MCSSAPTTAPSPWSPATGVLPPRPDESIRSTREDLPAWRRASVLWIFLHLAIGIALWIGGMAFCGLVAEWLHRNIAEASEAAVSFVFLSFFSVVGGWLSFVYLRRPFKTRAIVLAALVGGSLVLTCAANVAFSPPLS